MDVSTKKCPECGVEVTDRRRKYCENCRDRIGVTGRTRQAAMKPCPRCKEPVRTDWKLCPECGVRFRVRSKDPNGDAQPQPSPRAGVTDRPAARAELIPAGSSLPATTGSGGMQVARPGVPVAAARTPAWAPQQPDVRRWQIALLLAGGIAAAAIIASGIFYTSGDSWRRRALSTQAQLTSTQAQLAASQRDVGSLESRLASLANEKAQVEDENAALQSTTDLYAQITTLSKTVADQLEDCIEVWEEFTTMIINYDRYSRYEFDRVTREGGRICGEARANNSRLTQLIYQLV